MHSVSRDPMDIFKMPAQIAALSEGLLAERAFERSQACVLAEVISQITAFLEHTSAVRVLALEVELHPLSLRVLYPNCLVPLFRNTLEGLMLVSS